MDALFLPALNYLLGAAPWARSRLQAHAGEVACLRLEALAIRFVITAEGLVAGAADDAPVAVSLHVPASALPRFAMGQFDGAMGAVRIEGNAEFADALGFVLRNLRWDVEEDLSRVLGDVAAHRLVGTAQAAAATLRDGAGRMGGSLAEYLSEEQGMLVPARAAELLGEEVRALRDAIARAEKRIERLERNLVR